MTQSQHRTGTAPLPVPGGSWTLPGGEVEIVAALGRGAQAAVFHIRRAGADYALKVLHGRAVHHERIATEFRREAALLARVDHPGVPKVYDVGVSAGRPYLVLEMLRGRTLAGLLESGGPIPEARLTALAADVASALGASHRAGLVHRDLKPANVMVTDSGRAVLIDFGLAAQGHTRSGTGPAVGTFDYSPPEQSGMLNRPVDRRSDLYALGVVLFECGTGVLPFTAGTVGDVIAQHAHTPAPDPRTVRPDLSASFAAVVGRLLAKDPDDRFQTAEDLLAALGGRTAGPAATTAPLAGRDAERTALSGRWAQARGGSGGIALLSGPAGSGKSSLARDFAATARAGGALVLSGKCDADSALPLAALRDAVEDHLRAVTALPDDERDAAMAHIRAAAGTGASLLRSLSPALAVLLEAPVLAADHRHDQFAGAVASFLAALPGAAGGVLIVDDVQWMDEASRAVVRRLVEDLADAPLLVVATARDDEDSTGGLDAFTEAAGTGIDLRVPVGPLDERATAALVSDYLAGSAVGPEVTAELSARGRGNPFTILEFLRSLIDVGALRPSWGTWRLDRDLLQRVSLPTDVLDLVLARIGGLAPSSRDVLTVAAAAGTVVDEPLLAEMTGTGFAPALADALDRGLMHAQGNRYAFVHDRVREALLSAVSPADRRALHQRIATVLDQQRRTDAAGVYATAQHYAHGETDRTPERVFHTGWAAGRLALDENAPDAALTFLNAADAAARPAGIVPDSRFREALGVACWSTGRIEPARAHLEAGLAGETDPVRRAALLLQLSHVLRTGWELSRAVACARQGLAELGVTAPGSRARFAVSTARTLVRWLAAGDPPPAAEPARGEEAERLQLRVLLARAGVAAAAIDLRHGQVMAFALLAALDAHRLGATAGYLSQLAATGTVAGSMGLDKRREELYDRAIRIATELGDPKAYANVAWYEAFAKLLANRSRLAEWADVTEAHRRYLEVDFYTNILLMRCRDLIQRGYPAEALAWHNRGRSRISQATADAFPGFGVVASMAHALMGQVNDDPAELAARSAEPLDAGHGIQFMLGAVQTALEQDELGASFEQAVAAFDGLGRSTAAILTEYRMFFAYVAFARLTQLQRCDDRPGERARRLAAAEEAIGRLHKAARTSGPGSGALALTLLRGYHVVARAGLAQLRGRAAEALSVLAAGDTDLVRLDAPLVEYEAARVRARALAALGFGDQSARQARAALQLATEHGWSRRSRWIRIEFGAAVGPARRSLTFGQSASDATANPYRRRLDALLQVSIAAAKVLDPQHMARVALDETLRILGAERAILFRTDEHGRDLRPSLGRSAGGTDLAELSEYSASLVDRVAAEREPLVVTGSEEGAALGSQSAVVYGLRSIMIAPLELEERLIGVVYLDSRIAKGVFTDADVDILTAVSSQIAVSLETARAAQLEVAVEAARKQRDTADLLRTSMSELSSTIEPQEVLAQVLAVMRRALPADRFCLVHADGGEPTVLTHGPVDRTGVSAELVTTGPQPVHGDLTSAPAGVARILPGAASFLAVPMPGHEHGRGVLIAGSAAAGTFTRSHADVLSAVAGQAAAAYEKARLFAKVQELATTDELTGAYNRRHFSALAGNQVSIAERNHRPLVAMMLDIDHFKRVNDTWGHAAGDEVIRSVAQVLRAHIRRPDVFGRYGGEEFAVVLSEVHGDPLETAERLRVAVERLRCDGPGGPIGVTISIGVAELKPDDTLESVLGRADQALYAAKRAGRNRVTAG